MTNTVVADETMTFAASGVSVSFPGENNYISSVFNLSSNNASPNVWLASDSLAKSFYSTIMTDLGQTTATPNILLNATTLQYFTQNFTEMQKSPVNAKPGPANDSYEALKGQTGPLNTSAAVISTKYLCQVPRRKSTEILFMSVLVADFVFMQVLWNILNLCSGAWLAHKDPKGKNHPCLFNDAVTGLILTESANYCSGCAKQVSILLVSLGTSTYEQEPRPSSEIGIRRHGTRYSRSRSPDEIEGIENTHSLRLGF